MFEKYSARLRRRVCLAMTAAALLVTASFFGSCTHKAPVAGAAALPSSPATTPGATAPPASAQPQRPIDDSHQPATKAAPPLAASMRAFGIGAQSVPLMPEDFSLGPLQSYSPDQGDEAAVFAVARAFMDGLAAGKLNKDLLLPEMRDALSLLLAPPDPPASAASGPKGGAASYRLGAIVIRGEDASLKVRLPSTDALEEAKAVRQEGLLSLRRAGGSWYVEALALGPPVVGALAFAPDPREKAK